jgi:hypothetical protein
MQARRLVRLLFLNMWVGTILFIYAVFWTWLSGNIIPGLGIALSAVQLVISFIIWKYMRALSPSSAGERLVLLLSYWLVLFSCLQLGLTPIISGNSSCNCQWDKYSAVLKFFQALGSAVSLGASAIGCYAGLSAFANNSAIFTVRQPLEM